MSNAQVYSRRVVLRQGAGALLAAGLWPGALAAKDTDHRAFSFILVNDLHYFDKQCGPWFDGLVKQLKAQPERFEFVLLAGDLAENGTLEQLQPTREHFQMLDRPVYTVIGNHDYRRHDDRQAYEKAFPKSLNYWFEHHGWQFVGLDSSEGTKAYVTVQPATLQWLDETVPKLDRSKPTVVFTHFPYGPLVIYRVRNADAVLERFKEHNLKAVFSGHYHAATERKHGSTVLTTSRCCSRYRKNHDGSKEKGYFLCTARDGELKREFVEFQGS
jgi:3',5'-cyclic AMP phosphodiesterase CpdA